MKTSQTAVCRKYAQSFLAAGGNPSKRRAELEKAAEILSPYLKILSHPCLNPAVKNEILGKISGVSGLGIYMGNFLRILIENKRIAFLGEIAKKAVELADEAEGFKSAEVESRFDLAEDELKGIKEALSAVFSRKIKVRTLKNEELIGGIRIKSGDLLIDGSVRGRLEAIRRKTLA